MLSLLSPPGPASALVILGVLLLHLAVPLAHGRVHLRLGVLVPVEGGWNVNHTVEAAVPIAIEDLRKEDVNSDLYELSWVLGDSKCNAKDALAVVSDMYTKPASTGYARSVVPEDQKDHPVSAFIGPGCSSACKVTQLLIQHWNLPQISWASESSELSDVQTYPTFTRTIGPSTKAFEAYDALFRRNNWKHVALISTVDTSKISLANYLSTQWANSSSVEVLDRYVYSSDAPLGDESHLRMRTALRRINATRARVISIHGYKGDLREIALAARELGMLEGYAYITLNLPTDAHLAKGTWQDESHLPKEERRWEAEFGPERDAEAARAMKHWISIEQRVSDDERTTAFLNQVKERHSEFFPGIPFGGEKASVYAANLYDAVALYGRAAGAAIRDGEDPRDGLAMFKRLTSDLRFDGMAGRVELDENGDRDAEWNIYENVGSDAPNLTLRATHPTVAPEYDLARDDVAGEWLFPGGFKDPPPSKSDEPEVETRLIRTDTSSSITTAVTVVSVLVLLASVATAVLVARKRRTPAIRLSSPLLAYVMLAGCIIGPIVPILFAFPHRSSAQCMMIPTLIAVSFTLVFGSIVARAWRVHVIFNNLSRSNVIKSGKLLGFVAALFAIDVAIMAAWWIVEPLEPIDQIATGIEVSEGDIPDDPDDPDDVDLGITREYRYEIRRCSGGNLKFIFIALLLVAKVSVIAAGIRFAYLTRSVSLKDMRDAKSISMSIYNTAVLVVLGAPAIAIAQMQVTRTGVLAVVVAVVVLIFCLSILVIVFGPKLHLVYIKGEQTEGESTAGGFTTEKKGGSIIFRANSHGSASKPSSPTDPSTIDPVGGRNASGMLSPHSAASAQVAQIQIERHRSPHDRAANAPAKPAATERRRSRLRPPSEEDANDAKQDAGGSGGGGGDEVEVVLDLVEEAPTKGGEDSTRIERDMDGSAAANVAQPAPLSSPSPERKPQSSREPPPLERIRF